MKQKNFFRRLFSVLAMIAFSSLLYAEVDHDFLVEDSSGKWYYKKLTDSTVSLVGFTNGKTWIDGGILYVSRKCTDENNTTYTITEIGDGVFNGGIDHYNNISFKLDNAASKIEKIGDCAFKDCGTTDVLSYASDLKYIGNHAFEGCVLDGFSSSVQRSVETIGDYAFHNGYLKDKELKYLDNLKTIGEYAFSKTKIEKIDMSKLAYNEQLIFEETFDDLTQGSNTDVSVTCPGWNGNEKIPTADKGFEAQGAVKLGNSSASGSLTTVPLNVLKGDSVTIEIDVKGWSSVGGPLLVDLTGCEQQSVTYKTKMNGNFETVTVGIKYIPESDPVLTISTSSTESKGEKRCFIDGIRVYRVYRVYRDAFPDGVFCDCESLTSVVLPNGTTNIPKNMFRSCYALETITGVDFDNLGNIGDSAFYRCNKLAYPITISEDATSIGNAAFAGCFSLTSIAVAERNANYDSRNNCNAIIEKSTNTLIAGCMNTVIPDGVTSIGDNAFYYCSSLASISIPDGVTSIGDNAFYYCTSLASISIPDGVTSIGDNAFYDCFSLTSISIPESVTSIGNAAFAGCSSLTSSISIPKSVTSIGDEAFYYCSYLTSISIPESVTSIGYRAFFSCSSLTSISIPEGVTSIGDEAFRYCSYLTSIISLLNPTSTSLGSDVFESVNKTIPLYVPASLVDKYKNADQWKDFTNILPIDGGIKVSVGSDGLATYCPPVGVDFSEATNIAAYRAAVDGSTVTLTKADKVNAGEGVLLRSLNGGAVDETLPLSIYSENAENAFVGVSKQKTIYETDTKGNTNFVLSKVNGVVGFYKAKSQEMGGTSISDGKAYLPVKGYDATSAIKGLSLVFEDGFATGIDIVDSEQEQASDDDTYYTIGGLPVKNPTQKGVYIKGGKKYIIK